MADSQAPEPAADADIGPSLLAPLTDESGSNDSDSVYGGSVAGTETQSLLSSITKYREENGRTYHAYGSTEYWGPNDDRAQDQQDLSHHLWMLALKGKHFLAPIKEPLRILDLGCGTGIWVIDVADAYPSAQVKGVDLSPIQPTWTPPNAKFEVDDYNIEWLDESKYDLIHARELLGTVPDWVELYRKAYRALKPGGWFDQAEPSLFFFSELTELDESHPYSMWGTMMKEAGIRAGMRFDIGDKVKGWLEEAGFVNVHEYRMPWAIGGWPKDEHLREVGKWNLLRLDMGISDFSSRRMTNNMGWTPNEIEVFCGKLRSAFREKKLYGLQWAYFIWGQKPEDA